jgi:hypothetical protein
MPTTSVGMAMRLVWHLSAMGVWVRDIRVPRRARVAPRVPGIFGPLSHILATARPPLPDSLPGGQLVAMTPGSVCP